MDSSFYYLKVFAAFVFVIALMYLISFALRRWGGQAAGGAAKNPKLFSQNGKTRLRVIDSAVLDYRRRLVLVEYNNKGYMVLLGPQSENVVAAGITLAKEDKNADEKT